MFSRPRILPILLLGLDIVLLVAGILLPRVFNVDPKTPLDLPSVSYTLRTEDGVFTRANEEGKREEVYSPLQRQPHGVLIESADVDKVSFRVGVTEMRELSPEIMGAGPLTEFIRADIWITTTDRFIGEALAPTTPVSRMVGAPRSVDLEGNWVRLPTDMEEKEYPTFGGFFHDSLPAKFVGEEECGGNRILHLRRDIEETDLVQRYRSYVSQLTQDDKSGFLQYQDARDLWVELKSGSVIDMVENIHLQWKIRGGESIMDYLHFDGGMNEDLSDQLLFGTIQNFQRPTLELWSIGLITPGSILVFIVIASIVRPSTRRKVE